MAGIYKNITELRKTLSLLNVDNNSLIENDGSELSEHDVENGLSERHKENVYESLVNINDNKKSRRRPIIETVGERAQRGSINYIQPIKSFCGELNNEEIILSQRIEIIYLEKQRDAHINAITTHLIERLMFDFNRLEDDQ